MSSYYKTAKAITIQVDNRTEEEKAKSMKAAEKALEARVAPMSKEKK